MTKLNEAERRIFAHHLFQGLLYDNGVYVGEQKAKNNFSIPEWKPNEDDYQWIELMWHCIRTVKGLQQEMIDIYGSNLSHLPLRKYLNIDEERFKKSPHYTPRQEGIPEVIIR